MDVWALGISIYTVVFGRVPFFEETEHELIAAITKTEPDFSLPVAIRHKSDESDKISDELKFCLQGLLTKDPEHRPSIKEAIERFAWFQF